MRGLMAPVSGRVLLPEHGQACDINTILSPGTRDTGLIKATLLRFTLKYRQRQRPFSKILLLTGGMGHGWLAGKKQEISLLPSPSMKCIWGHGGKYRAMR